ncbi:MAG TPA: phosphoglycerate kinase [Candidatus Parcubacteria bacterium]|jgi:phosphoglycerate kinase|nr:phosphoglycerate kinase [Parcubacteria group bacterium]HJN62328.1 phosphoglycerate kinase [Candidatus Parcubacteria bacterium]
MLKTLKDFNLQNKRVLVRCDFNVPLDERGNILDDFRIKQTIPTIKYLIEKGAKLLLMSHLGRPGGRVVESLRLTLIQDKLMEYLDLSITKAADCIGPEVEKWSQEMNPGEILLLENLRFHKEEETNDDKFAKELAKMGDIYINDAFAVSHRTHASIVGVPEYLPSGAGFLLEKEIKVLSDLLKNPKKPMIAIIGGVKVETKAKVIDKISEIADWVLVSNVIQKEIEEKSISFKYPKKIIKPVDGIKKDGKILDIGPKTINLFLEKIVLAKTIFWSGPLGKIEKKEFQKGSLKIAKAIIKGKSFSLGGGGETVKFINKIGFREKFNHISTGGGAMLKFLSGDKLPGIEALELQK